VPYIPGQTKKTKYLAVLLVFIAASLALGQSEVEQVDPILGEEILSPHVALFQIREYLLRRVAKPPAATTAREWTTETNRLRQHLLNDVVFHGWPKEWVNARPKFEDLGVIEAGQGYRLRKLRYEILPGFQSVAILYEPENIDGKIPAVLNVNGHVGPPGKSVEYKQKRCINFAKHGIMALNLEWFLFGELASPENAHWFGAHLDLVGANALGLFYLEMRRGLDYLYDHPHVDRSRLGVTGLSGGGWQTIVLSALDERVTVSVPVAGYSATTTKIEARKYGDLGDLEQNSTDLLDGLDYTHLTAMRAPRPTLLINNAEDDCCFRGPLVRPLIFDGIRPFFKSYGKEDKFQYHENRDPSTHNYQLDNRLAAYRFLSQQFGLPPIESEIPAGQELKSYDELVVGLPKDNLTILGLARKMSQEITRPPIPSGVEARAAWAASERQKLSGVVRYKPVGLGRLWAVANTKNKGVETKSYLFEMADGLSANGVWLKGIATPANAPATIVLNDKGKKAAGAEVSDRVNRDEQVLALDLLFTGDAWKDNEPYSYAQILDGMGERPIGLEAAQLIAIAHWLQSQAGTSKLRLETTGVRNQVAALVAAALEPNLFSELVVHEGMSSLNYALEAPVTFQDAPELFCLDLYKDFDLDRLAAVAAPTRVTAERYLKMPQK
jgi:dienelactone hydrolase